ncbi:hypothetical protein GGF32_000602 [Allomyces javanicus]|nr:hypothetical protein GGF32_000602 [Allomyces javanicus]
MPGPTTTRHRARSSKNRRSPSPPKQRRAWGDKAGSGGDAVYVPRGTSSSASAASGFMHGDDGHAIKSLTEATILSRNKARTLADVTELNVWGSQLDDASILQLLPQLRIASLSVNKLTTLAPFLGLTNLEELYLRRNLVGIDLIAPEATANDHLAVLVHELAFLADCPKLSVLWLSENPISEWDPALYRVAVARILPQVKQLDNKPISTKERQLAQQLALDLLHADVAPRRRRRRAGRDASVDGPILREPVTTARAGRDESADGPMPDSVARIRATAKARARGPTAWTIPARDDDTSDAASVSSPGSPVGRDAEVGEEHKNNVLFAVLALIRELDPVALRIVKKEVDRMAK